MASQRLMTPITRTSPSARASGLSTRSTPSPTTTPSGPVHGRRAALVGYKFLFTYKNNTHIELLVHTLTPTLTFWPGWQSAPLQLRRRPPAADPPRATGGKWHCSGSFGRHGCLPPPWRRRTVGQRVGTAWGRNGPYLGFLLPKGGYNTVALARVAPYAFEMPRVRPLAFEQKNASSNLACATKRSTLNWA